MNNKTTAGLIIKQLNINNNNRFNNFRNKKNWKGFFHICKTIPTRSVDCDTFSTMYFGIKKTHFEYQLKNKVKLIFINYYTKKIASAYTMIHLATSTESDMRFETRTFL